MLFSYGPRITGIVDIVEGLGHVETEFMYAHPVPLFPIQSCLVHARTGSRVAIPLSYKSIVSVYLRLLTVIVGVAFMASLLLLFMPGPQGRWPISIAFFVAGIVILSSTWLPPVRAWFSSASASKEAYLSARCSPSDR